MKPVTFETRAACCRLCVTITMQYLLAQRLQGFLDAQRRDRIEGGGGLVEQQDFRLHRDAPRNAQPLLLAAGEAAPVGIELVLDLVPHRRVAQRRLHALLDVRGAHPSANRSPKATLSNTDIGNGVGF